MGLNLNLFHIPPQFDSLIKPGERKLVIPIFYENTSSPLISIEIYYSVITQPLFSYFILGPKKMLIKLIGKMTITIKKNENLFSSKYES